MLSSNTPARIPLPFATSGSKNTIPEASQIGITPGAASLTDGFPPLTMTPIAAGGIPPFGQDMNGVLFGESSISRWLCAGGKFTYNSAFATDINVGGYPKGAVLLRADGTGAWLSLSDNNTDDPDAAVSANWAPQDNYGITAITGLTDANVTLTAVQAAKDAITCTGVLTGNVQIIVPTWLKTWTITNSTTGNFTLTVQTAGGSGVVIPAGRRLVVYGDGTNIGPAASSFGLYARNFIIAAVNTTLTFLACGGVVEWAGGGGGVLALPTLAECISLGSSAIVFVNTGSGSVLIAPQGSDALVPGGSITLQVGDTLHVVIQPGGGWIIYGGSALMQRVPYSAAGAVSGVVKNLAASATGTSATVTVSADEVAVENAGNAYQTLRGVALSISGASSGANGLDTGALATSTWYSVWVIYNGTTIAGLLSLSATAPTLPSGYTFKARVGWIRTDSSGNKYPLSFIQAGRRAQYKVAAGSNVAILPAIISGVQGSPTTPTWQAAAIANFVPPTAGSILVVLSNPTNSANMIAAPNNAYGSATSTSNPPPMMNDCSTNSANQIGELLLESTNIYYAADNASVSARCFGWTDNL